MKVKLFLMLLGSSLMISCNQKEMKISRSDFSVQIEMIDFSPVYISKNDKGKVEINKNNLIGNTHWVISADRDLTLNEIAPFLQQLTEKKYNKGGLHPDTKDIYFVYSDTVHKQNAYVELPFKEIYIDVPPPIENMGNRFYLHEISSANDFKEKISEALSLKQKDEKISVGFESMTTEEFVNILIGMEKQDIIKTIDISTSIY